MWMRSFRRMFKKSDQDVVCDLDAILTKTISFRWNGRVHDIKPLKLDEFLLVSNALAKLDHLRMKDKVSADELIDAYAEIFEIVCPTIKRRDVSAMGVQRVGALYQLVIETIMGKAEFEAQKKRPSAPTGQLRMSQSAQA